MVFTDQLPHADVDEDSWLERVRALVLREDFGELSLNFTDLRHIINEDGQIRITDPYLTTVTYLTEELLSVFEVEDLFELRDLVLEMYDPEKEFSKRYLLAWLDDNGVKTMLRLRDQLLAVLRPESYLANLIRRSFKDCVLYLTDRRRTIVAEKLSRKSLDQQQLFTDYLLELYELKTAGLEGMIEFLRSFEANSHDEIQTFIDHLMDILYRYMTIPMDVFTLMDMTDRSSCDVIYFAGSEHIEQIYRFLERLPGREIFTAMPPQLIRGQELKCLPIEAISVNFDELRVDWS